MSVTFWCPKAPSERNRVPCDSPNYGLTCTTDERCGYCEDGWTTKTVTDCPEVNLSNINAGNVLRLLGLYNPEGPWGELTLNEIPNVLRRVMGVLNRTEDRDHLVRDFSDERAHEPRIKVDEDTGLPTISSGCRVINMGNTDERTVERLTAIQTLLVWAADHNFAVSWG